MIVGHKIGTYLTAVRNGYRNWTITEHVVVNELHATKGWRAIQHRRKDQKVTKLPPIDEWRACNVTKFIPTERSGMPKWSRPDFVFRTESEHVASLMRHRERRRDSQIAENIARNKLEDQRLAGLR